MTLIEPVCYARPRRFMIDIANRYLYEVVDDTYTYLYVFGSVTDCLPTIFFGVCLNLQLHYCIWRI